MIFSYRSLFAFYSQDIVTESESFDVEKFIPLLQKYIRRTNPYVDSVFSLYCSHCHTSPF